jgi:hypothetical protein
VFNIEPHLSEYAAIHHRVAAPVPPGMDFAQFKQHLTRTHGDALAECKELSGPGNATSYFEIRFGLGAK